MANVKIKRARQRVIKPTPKKKPVAGIKKPTGKTKPSFADARRKMGGATGFAGAKGFQQAGKEKKRSDENRRKRMLPWRLWMAPGTEREVILLDKEPYFMYEHEFKGADGHKQHERCIKDQGSCPLCNKLNREGYYVMMLTCIDLSPYTTKAGKTVKASRKFFPVKQQQIGKFERMYTKNKGSFRGLRLHLVRDGDRDSVIGNDIDVVRTLNETALAKYGTELTTPIKYEEAFPILSEKAMAARYGTATAMGANEFSNKKKDDDEEADDTDDWG